LLAQLFPPGKILLERFGAGSGQGHSLPLERQSGAALSERLVVAPQLIEQLACFLKLTGVFIAEA
jgi:hypothetical protein